MGSKTSRADLATFKPDHGITDIPTSVSWMDGSLFAAGYAVSESLYLFDVNRQQPLQSYSKPSKDRGAAGSGGQPNRVRCTQQFIFSGHESKVVRVYDIRKSLQIKEFIAHSDAVTGLNFDPATYQLITSGHDGNIRVWDIRTYKCMNDLKVAQFIKQANRKKYDEAIFNIDSCKGRHLVSGTI